MCKLGDGAYKKFEKETAAEMAKEESQISKIRILVKERNRQRHQTRAPPAKRRKTGEEEYTSEKDPEKISILVQVEKRKPEEMSAQDQAKRQRTGDIREFLQEKPRETAQEKRQEPVQEVFFGEEIEAEMID